MVSPRGCRANFLEPPVRLNPNPHADGVLLASQLVVPGQAVGNRAFQLAGVPREHRAAGASNVASTLPRGESKAVTACGAFSIESELRRRCRRIVGTRRRLILR